MANIWNNAVARHLVNGGAQAVDISDLNFTSAADYWVFWECGQGYALNNSDSASPPIIHRTKDSIDVVVDIAPATIVIVPLGLYGKDPL